MDTAKNDYTQWDYDNRWDDTIRLDKTSRISMADNTKMSIYNLFKEGDTKKITDFLTWLKEEQSNFIFSYRDFIFTRLVEFKHFSITDELCANKPYQFDEKIAKTCAGNLALTFDGETFDYWRDRVEKLDETQQSTVIRKFWTEFLTYQFLRPQDFNTGIENLFYVFEKVPFYLDLGRDISNGYLIKERADCFNTSRLNTNQQSELLKELGILCANKYLHAKDLFIEEFAKHPAAIESFNTVLLHHSLDESLSNKKSSTKIKI